MHAILLDIDGTLLDSDGVDGELYIAAVERVLGPVRIRSSWEKYRHVTDSGILHEILVDNRASGDEQIIEAVKSTFIQSLRQYIQEHGPFEEIPGARAFVQAVCGDNDCAWGYATGCWSTSARIKLVSAGFPVEGVPISSADDSNERCGILQHALQQLSPGCETVTYYGDGVWDREAALSLGWRFVPVGAKLGGMTRFDDRKPSDREASRTRLTPDQTRVGR